MHRLVFASLLLFSTGLAADEPPRDKHDATSDRYAPIDLQPHGNQKLDEDFHGYAGNNLKPLPKGRQRFDGVLFRVGEKLIQLAGKRAPDWPERVDGIKVGQKFAKLHFLHGTGWGSPGVEDGTQIGQFVVRFDDKSSETIPIIYGEDVRDWWTLGDNDPVKRGTVAWTGVNEASKNFRGTRVPIRLFRSEWENPHADRTIVSLEYVSANETISSPFLVAVTGEKAADEKKAVERLKEVGAFLEFDSAGRAVAVSLSGPGPVAGEHRGTDAADALLADLPALEKVYLNSTAITDDALPFLKEHKRLRWLSLNLSGIGDEGLAHLQTPHTPRTVEAAPNAGHGCRASGTQGADPAEGSRSLWNGRDGCGTCRIRNARKPGTPRSP